jgi:hypothetical protein
MATRDFAEFMDFGLGIDDVNGKIRNLAVTGGEPVTVPGTGGQVVQFRLVKTESLEQVHTALGLSVNGSGFYSTFSASEKFSFVESSSFQSYSVFLLVQIMVRNASTHLLGEKLVESANFLLANGKKDRFREEFGDLYIKGIETGGEFWSIVEIQTTDTTDQTDISNQLEVGGFFGGGGADVKTTFTSNFQKVTSNHSLKIQAYQVGGAGAGAKQQVSIGEVIEKAQNFANEVLLKPVAYRVELQDYGALDIPEPPNPIDVQNAKDVLQRFADDRTVLFQLQNNTGYIKQHPEQFETFDDNTLTALAGQVSTTLNQLTRGASKCLNNVKECEFQVSTIPSISLLPKRKKNLQDDALIAKGEAITNQDPLAVALRSSLPDAPSQRGFNIGMAVAEGQTLPGPGKDSFGRTLRPEEQSGYAKGVLFSVDRNRNLDMATKGAAIAKRDPVVAAARTADPSAFYSLGFDIATGIFGDLALGGAGHTSEGPGSQAIRDGLNADGQKGFRAAVDLYLVQKHKA